MFYGITISSSRKNSYSTKLQFAKISILPSAFLEPPVFGLGNTDEVLAPLLHVLFVLLELLPGKRVSQPVAAYDDDRVGHEVHHGVHDGGLVALRLMQFLKVIISFRKGSKITQFQDFENELT